MTVISQMEAQAAATPDATAAICGNEQMSYADLNKQANRVAHYLMACGVGAESLVVIASERRVDTVAMLLGILKAGAAYLPLDLTQPPERLARIIDDAQPARVLVPAGLRGAIPCANVPVDAFEELPLSSQPDTDPGRLIDPAQLAYVIFTSGSTGKPKGVAVTHEGMTNYMEWAKTALGAGSALVHTSLAFDFTVTPLFLPLITGGAAILLPEGDTLDQLAATLREPGEDINLLKVTPSHLDALVARLGRDTRLTRVRTLLVGGEQFQGTSACAWRSIAPDTVIVNEYGPTEATVGCTGYLVPPDTDGPVPFGPPIAGMRAHVLDADLNPVPDGVTGDLYIGGPGVCRGYLNRRGLTADKFVPDPYAPVPGDRMYRTGDLARRVRTGGLEFCGRSDNQVKIRGFRVELGEIEACLASHAAVAAAAVMVREDRPGDRRIAGYVAPVPGTDIDLDELRLFLASGLPDYMVPATLTTLPELPFQGHGKVDKQRLPAPGSARPGLGTAYELPRTAAEQTVAQIWADVLGLETVGIHDNFFALGGHSLLGGQITLRVAEKFPRVPSRTLLRDLFRHPTVAGFTSVIAAATLDKSLEQVEATRPPPARAEIPRLDPALPHRLCLAQERLWFLDQLEANRTEYLIPIVLRLTGQLDVPALRAALTEIVTRHETLRTRVSLQGDQPFGVVAGPDAFQLEVRGISDADVARAGGMEAVAASISTQPLDLTDDLPFRAVLLRRSDHEHVLCLTAHHIAFDGSSHRVLTAELSSLYQAFTADEPAALPPLPCQYADVAHWQDSLLSGDALTSALPYWQETLDGATSFEFPPDFPRAARREGHGDVRTVTWPESLTKKLEGLGSQHGATLFMTLLAVCQAVFARSTGQDDVTVGTTAAERARSETEPLIGLFVNILMLRGAVSGNLRFADLLERTRDRAGEAYGHQDVPFDHLVKALAPDRDLSRTPLFQVLLQYSAGPAPSPQLPGVDVTRLAPPDIIAKYDLTIDFTREQGKGLMIGLEYDTGLYTESTIDSLLQRLLTVAGQVVDQPDTLIDQLPLMTASERDKTARSACGPIVDTPRRSLPDLVADQAARSPGAIAVVEGDRETSYVDLIARADKIADLLRDRGVRGETVVGLLLDRSTDMIAGILGILKAGGVYLPIETETPPARVALLLRDADAPVCLVGPGGADLGESDCVPVALTADLPAAGPASPHPHVHPDQLAALYYTSGSTGRPKGVACPHDGWVSRMFWMQHRHGLRPGETVLHKTTLTFDDAAVEIFWPLIFGGRIALLPPRLHRDPRAIADAAIRYRAVHLNFVPSMLELFLDVLAPADVASLAPLRSVLSSGEALRPAVARRFQECFGSQVSLDNTWGATEVSIDSTCHTVEPATADTPSGTVSIGRPIDNNQVHVLDGRLESLPTGVAGELYIGGNGLARGYLGDPARTAEAFVPDPFRTGQRLYRTGDWGRRRPDGTLEFFGRHDRQVKIRGVRIELGEVEAAVRTHPLVADVAVTSWAPSPADKRLAAYVASVARADLDTATIRRHLEQVLPSYAVPSSITVLDTLPRLANGKLDLRSLPAPDPAAVRDTPYVRPRTPTEQVLAEIWSAVLGVDRIGVDDNFFALGGHSLLATMAMGRMRRAFDTDLPLSLLFEAPTIAQAADRIEAAVMTEIEAMSEADALRLADSDF